jgi:hypothetical protein
MKVHKNHPEQREASEDVEYRHARRMFGKAGGEGNSETGVSQR